METIKAIAKRKSVRAYKTEQISKETLADILTAGCAAPVGAGMYNTLHLTVIQDEAVLKRLSDVSARMLPDAAKEMIMAITQGKLDPLYGAPTVVIISSIPSDSPGIDSVNAGCVAENMMLAATDAGIGSVVLGGAGGAVSADPQLKELVSIPDGYNALFGIAFGNAAAPDGTEKELKMTIDVKYI